MITDTSKCFFETSKTANDSIILSWGKNDFRRNIKMGYDFSFNQIFCDENRIVLLFSCGSPCWGYVILPTNNEGRVYTITYPLENTEDFSIILSGSEEVENEIIVYNFNNNTKGSVLIDSLNCFKTFYIDCFEITSLNEKSFTIQHDVNKDSWNFNDIKTTSLIY